MITDLRERLQATLAGAYTLERELSGGAMSRVFVALETSLGRRVVIKVLPPDLAEGLSPTRFRREIALAARLHHPNIVTVLTAGESDGMLFYTMPFIPGESLRQRIATCGALPVREAVSVLRDVARALAHAHREGVVHRDVKPGNVLLYMSPADDGVDTSAVVTDFGIAKAVAAAASADAEQSSREAQTEVGMTLGTPAYMAPEQAVGDTVDQRTDIYALGVLSYEMFAGVPPFAGHSAQQLVVAHLTEIPASLAERAPGVPRLLAEVVMRCLAKDPADRPQAITEVLHVLQTLRTDGTSMGATPHTEAISAPTIALLPFANLSADPDNEYFSDGITDEILSVLAQDRSLRVAARSSSFAFKGQTIDLKTIAERLRVETVLEGSVRRVGNRVRIAAQLVSAADGFHLWSDQFDRELTDIFAVQVEIAQAIASVLRRTLLPWSPLTSNDQLTNTASDGARHTTSVEAYDAYLKGRHANHRRVDGMHEARAHFERALQHDPGFAPAYAGLAQSYVWLGMYNALPPTEAFPRTRRHAEHALSLDHDLAETHHLLAYVAFWYDWDAAACERHLQSAFRIEPRHVEALTLAGHFYNMRGRRSDALAATALALRSDPLGLGSRTGALINYYHAGEYNRVIADATRLVGEIPEYSEARRWRGRASYMVGDLAEARSDFEIVATLTNRNPWVVVDLAVTACLAGQPAEAHRLAEELIDRSAREWVPPLAVGHVHQALGDYDAALDWYERAYQTRDFLLVMLHAEPELGLIPSGRTDPITADPRFAMLVRKVDMAP